ncbi:MAG: hypothetical protein A2168_07515 [Planctomycetes bacterium RBG_13_50_24]|nr:MAG: hypothetical protein A2168_07515 [Planctomycetes bacterium RBG_13_50_24]
MRIFYDSKPYQQQGMRLWFIAPFVLVLLVLNNWAFAALDLTEWTLVDPYNRWRYTNPTPESGRMDETTRSSRVGPGWVVSDFQLPDVPEVVSFSLTVEVTGGSDDDIIGFGFGYQDNTHFYLVDWKRTAQKFNWGDSVAVNDDTAEQGIKLKKIDGSWTQDGLWGGTDGLGVTTLTGPIGKGWVRNTSYQFEVDLTPDRIVVKLDGSELLNVEDADFRGGAVFLYGFSQDNIVFSNVTPEPATFIFLSLGALVLLRTKR